MTRHRSPQIRHEQILKAARCCFIRRGYFQTKVVDIANEADLSKGGIYFHFTSKREIFRALVEREYRSAMMFLDEIIVSNSSLTEKLRLLGQHFVDLFSDDQQSRFMITIGEMALRDEEVQKMVKDLQKHYYERIHALLESAEKQGELNPVDTQVTAVLLKSLIDGIQLNFALGLEIDAEKFIENAIIMITQGLLKIK